MKVNTKIDNMTLPGALVIEGHVQGLSNTRALGELGVPVYVIDNNRCLAEFSKYCTKHFRCPPFSSAEFIEFLISLAKEEHLNGWLIMASNDHIVEQLSKNHARLAPFYRFLVPNETTLDKIIDKGLLMQEAKKCSTHIPTTYMVKNGIVPDISQFPVLVKGCRGLSFYKTTHKKAIQVNTNNELSDTIIRLTKVMNESDFMIQEYVESEANEHTVSFTCFAIDGEIKTYWMGEKLREHPIKYGTATLAQSVLISPLLSEVTPLIRQLAYTGICEVEFIKDKKDGNFKLIEINPRTWLWVGLAKACGIDYAKIAYRHINGLPIDFPSEYLVGLKWINWFTDCIYSFKALFTGHLSFKNYIKSFRGSKVHAIWSNKDPLPGIVFPFMSFYIANKRK